MEVRRVDRSFSTSNEPHRSIQAANVSRQLCESSTVRPLRQGLSCSVQTLWHFRNSITSTSPLGKIDPVALVKCGPRCGSGL